MPQDGLYQTWRWGGLRILEHLNFGLADKGHRPVLPSLFCLAGNGEIEMLIDLPVVV